jgi:predicted negative regulator of RcsB-dependent stress response
MEGPESVIQFEDVIDALEATKNAARQAFELADMRQNHYEHVLEQAIEYATHNELNLLVSLLRFEQIQVREKQRDDAMEVLRQQLDW